MAFKCFLSLNKSVYTTSFMSGINGIVTGSNLQCIENSKHIPKE
jgi:hypothetical protein